MNPNPRVILELEASMELQQTDPRAMQAQSWMQTLDIWNYQVAYEEWIDGE